MYIELTEDDKATVEKLIEAQIAQGDMKPLEVLPKAIVPNFERMSVRSESIEKMNSMSSFGSWDKLKRMQSLKEEEGKASWTLQIEQQLYQERLNNRKNEEEK